MLRILIGFVLGGAIGVERYTSGQPAGVRTHMLVAGGAACFMSVAIFGFGQSGAPPDRIAAQIVSGVGFLGAGTIFRTRASVHGLTTAASIWVAAAIGMLSGAGMFAVGAFATAVALITLRVVAKLEPDKRRLEEQQEDR